MSTVLEVPSVADLGSLPVEVEVLDDPWVVSVTAWANDGAVVTLTWDEVACSVRVSWVEAGRQCLTVERESACKVSVRQGPSGRVEFWVWSRSDELGGQLVVRVDKHVYVSDALLRM